MSFEVAVLLVVIAAVYVYALHRDKLRSPKGPNDIRVYMMPNDGGSAMACLIEMLNRSAKTVDIAMYMFTNEHIAGAVKGCLRRGMRVRVITDQQLLGSNNSQIEDMIVNGAIVRSPKSPPIMHHKFVIIDDTTVFTGSINWTTSAFEVNYESLVMIRVPALVDHYNREFERLWTRIAKQAHSALGTAAINYQIRYCDHAIVSG